MEVNNQVEQKCESGDIQRHAAWLVAYLKPNPRKLQEAAYDTK